MLFCSKQEAKVRLHSMINANKYVGNINRDLRLSFTESFSLEITFYVLCNNAPGHSGYFNIQYDPMKSVYSYCSRSQKYLLEGESYVQRRRLTQLIKELINLVFYFQHSKPRALTQMAASSQSSLLAK